MRIVTTFDGKIVSDETGGHPVKDPFILIFVGVNLLRSLQGVKKGQLLATLSPTGLLTAEKGVEIVDEFDGFGRIETRTEERRVGTRCVGTCSLWWWPCCIQKN